MGFVAAAADQSVWPLTPYQVQVFVAVAPQPPLTPRLQSALCNTLSARIEAVLGAAWNAEVTPPPPALYREMVRGLADLRADQIPLPPPQVDKVLLVAVAGTADGMTVTARDFDVRTRVLNTAVTRPVWQTGALGEAALEALLAAFAPVARIERLEKDGMAVLRPKATGLPLGDRKLALLREGDVLQPIVRYQRPAEQLPPRRAGPLVVLRRGEGLARRGPGQGVFRDAGGNGRQAARPGRVAGAAGGSARRRHHARAEIAHRAQGAVGRLRSLRPSARQQDPNPLGPDRPAGPPAGAAGPGVAAGAAGQERQRPAGPLADGPRPGAAS